MIINNIQITNFKSFKTLNTDLGNFNVLIGPNASGKSNFVQIFAFLRDIANSGLNNAISMQGGVRYLRNIGIGASEDLSFRVISNKDFLWAHRPSESGSIKIRTYETVYEFILKFRKRGLGFEITKDTLTQKCEFFKDGLEKAETLEKDKIAEGEIVFSQINKEVKVDFKPEKLPIKTDDVYPIFLRGYKLLQNTLLLERLYFSPWLVDIFRHISIYDFDPRLPKKATPITGKAELEEDGSNLSIILKNISEDRTKKRKLFNMAKDLLPFISDLGVEKFADKSLLFKLKEVYFKNEYLPASLISDGTINITALIVALYIEKKRLMIMEEPERNIHPYLISKVIDMMKDASQKKQIIITTHNPEIVKHAGLDNILLVSRDQEGFSRVSRPTEKEEVKTFLQNEIGIEELYVQDLLKA